jgi:hypothetical protein
MQIDPAYRRIMNIFHMVATWSMVDQPTHQCGAPRGLGGWVTEVTECVGADRGGPRCADGAHSLRIKCVLWARKKESRGGVWRAK